MAKVEVIRFGVFNGSGRRMGMRWHTTVRGAETSLKILKERIPDQELHVQHKVLQIET